MSLSSCFRHSEPQHRFPPVAGSLANGPTGVSFRLALENNVKHVAIAPCEAVRATLLRPARKCYIASMTTAEDIEKAVEQLAPHELARFRAWFEAFDARV
jgi:hypothetical protein